MRSLLLLFALQFQSPPVRATAGDSATARSLLLRGVAALDSSNADLARSFIGTRYLEQLRLWGMKEEGSNAAFRLDSEVMHSYRTGSTHNTYYWLSTLLEAGDTLTAERFIERIPMTTRDEVLSLVVRNLMHARPAIVARLEGRITKPWPRAEQLRHRALFVVARTDSAAARAMLSEAINLARTDTVFGTWSAWTWMIELLNLGGAVAIDDIVQAAIRPEGDLWNARAAIANALYDSAMSTTRRALIDSLEAGIDDAEPLRRSHRRIRLLYLRGTESDSALARAIGDSLSAAALSPNRLEPQLERNTQLSDLYPTTSTLNVARLRSAFLRPISPSTLEQFLQHVRVYTKMPMNDVYRPLGRDSLRAYAQVVVDLSGEQLQSLLPVVRDSLQVNRVAVQAYLDMTKGLELARTIQTRRFRDRAVAEVIELLVRVDAIAAEREATSLADSSARAQAWSTLSQAAVAGGRLATAATLATNATGEPRIRALFRVANAQFQAQLHQEARQTVTLAIGELDAEFRCHGCIVISTAGSAPLTRGTEPQLLVDVVALAMQLGMRDSLLSWASMQQTPATRANAHLVVVEAMSRHLLGWYSRLPLH